ncbi:MAG: phage tail sheath C-terminal domain-containing protein [Phascolarctobacterium succinatutens]|nr:phage tail sheath C-terminal domain-containing protein [Phascolarctobacterium succinatutens]
MAKLGMPSVIISFEEAGITAIERSKRGIVALILEEPKESITKLLTDHQDTGGNQIKAITNPFTVYTTDDISSELTEQNQEYLRMCLKGYVTTPYRIKVMLQETSESSAATKWDASLKILATDRWDYLAIPTIEQAAVDTVSTWIKTNRENKFKKIKAVLPGCTADYEGIVNFSNKKIKTATKEYTPAEYTARIAGLICGTPMTISATYAPLSEVIDCDKYDLDENDEKVNAGEFFIWYDGKKYKMSRAVNSLITTTQGKQEGYQTIKIVDVMDMIYDDIRNTAQDSYIGKYTNDYDNKCLLITAITGYLKQLEADRLLQRDYSLVDIDVEAVKNYQLSNGLYTKEELADMSDLEIKKLDTKKKVFLKAQIKILDAMEDIILPVSI